MATSMTSVLVDSFTERSLVVLVAVLAGILAITAPKIINFVRLASIPYIGSEYGNEEKRRQAYLQGARKLYYAGYDKVDDILPHDPFLTFGLR